jgi:hypothetical protein
LLSHLKVRSFADNKGNFTDLNMTLIPTQNLSGAPNWNPIASLPICVNPLVDSGVVLQRNAHKKHYLSACVFATGDPYQMARMQNVTVYFRESKNEFNVT